jgi:glycosyltransferase involved in cell wall biosynthesis
MNILFDHQFFPILRFSGITRYHYELARYLVKQPDCDVSLFMGWHINEFAFHELASETKHFFGMKRPSFRGGDKVYSRLNKIGLSLFSFLCKADLYHQTYYTFLLPNFKGKRVLTLHDMIYFLFPECFDKNDRIRDETRKSVEMAAGIITVSENSKKDIIEILHVPENKIQVTYEANSLSCPPLPENPIKRPYILYVGQRFHWKNFILLLNVYCRSELLNKNFDLVCFGGWDWTESEKEMIARFSLQDRVHKNSGPDELLATYYAHASALVYPSLYEGFGLPVLEAMHYGCPVVASNRASIPEIGGDAALYFDPADAEMLEHVLIKVLNSEDIRKDLSQKGPMREAMFSWRKCGEKTYDFYQRILQS